MRNLAGNEQCDHHIQRELARCRIKAVTIPKTTSEVPYSVIGELGHYRFTRNWYYWVCHGFVPIDVAKQLYNDSVGKTDIRVDGHCGCPAPEPPWAKYYDAEGREVLTMYDYEEMVRLSAKSPLIKKNCEKFAYRYRYASDPSQVAELYVTTYHIDSELGLYLFANAVRDLNRPLPPFIKEPT